MSVIEGAKQLLERQAAERVSRNPQQITLDDSNVIEFPGFPYTFEALHERILVALDIFKSGYECKDCVMGKIVYQCSCVREAHPGKKFSIEQLEAIAEALSQNIADERASMPCPECGGDPKSVERDETCDKCKGSGVLLELPDDTKNLPTTGVVVSMGPKAEQEAGFKVGDRILFTPHSGGGIPTKSGILLKYMDWRAGICKIGGASDLNAFDFILTQD